MATPRRMPIVPGGCVVLGPGVNCTITGAPGAGLPRARAAISSRLSRPRVLRTQGWRSSRHRCGCIAGILRDFPLDKRVDK